MPTSAENFTVTTVIICTSSGNMCFRVFQLARNVALSCASAVVIACASPTGACNVVLLRVTRGVTIPGTYVPSSNVSCTRYCTDRVL